MNINPLNWAIMVITALYSKPQQAKCVQVAMYDILEQYEKVKCNLLSLPVFVAWLAAQQAYEIAPRSPIRVARLWDDIFKCAQLALKQQEIAAGRWNDQLRTLLRG